jgi:hypothetical protein
VGDEVEIDGGILRVERVDGPRVDRVRYTAAVPVPDGIPVTSHDAIVNNISKDLDNE